MCPGDLAGDRSAHHIGLHVVRARQANVEDVVVLDDLSSSRGHSYRPHWHGVTSVISWTLLTKHGTRGAIHLAAEEQGC